MLSIAQVAEVTKVLEDVEKLQQLQLFSVFAQLMLDLLSSFFIVEESALANNLKFMESRSQALLSMGGWQILSKSNRKVRVL